MRYLFPTTRFVRGATSATLSYQAYDADGEPAAPSGAVTVTVSTSDGTALYTDAATSGTTTDPRTFTLAAADLDTIERLTIVWSDAGTVVRTEYAEVVSGTIGSVATIKAAETSLAGDTNEKIQAARKAAEDRFVSAREVNRSPFLRLIVQRFDGTGTYRLTGAHLPDLEEVRWARVYSSATTYTALTAAQLAAIVVPDEMARFERTDSTVWAAGRQNIEIGYVAGLRNLPQDLRDAMHAAVRYEVNNSNTSVPQQAQTFQSFDGITVGLARPGQRGAVYGVDAIDAIYRQYADPRPQVG